MTELSDCIHTIEYPYTRSTGPFIGPFLTGLRDGKGRPPPVTSLVIGRPRGWTEEMKGSVQMIHGDVNRSRLFGAFANHRAVETFNLLLTEERAHPQR